ncbi:MAG: hypothetical protein ABFS28_15770 [Bacteroidota bacterium]
MKTNRLTPIFLSGLFLIIMTACPKHVEDVEIQDVDISEVKENTAVLSWAVSSDAYASVRIILNNETDLSESSRTIILNGNTSTSTFLEELTGLTKYSLTVELQDSNSEKLCCSDEKTFKTSCSKVPVKMLTRDSYTLRGNIYYLSSWTEKVPGILMMHGLGEVMAPWPESETMNMLIARGYACMSFNFRGHSNSEAFDIQKFKQDSGGFFLGCDMEAALSCLTAHDIVDPSSIGLMGGSMGGSASVIGNYFPQVKTSVALSPVIGSGIPFKNFFPELEQEYLISISYIVAENDDSGGYDFPGMSSDLYDITEEPRKLWIIPGIPHHGSSLATYPGVNDEIVYWFTETMPSPYTK